MTFGSGADEAESVKIMDLAFDKGVNFFDTANVYNFGVTEEIVGRWLRGRRQEMIVATKVHFPMSNETLNAARSTRRNIMLSVEESLRRLQTDWVDILYLHHWDDTTALDESLAAMTTLVEQGKVMYCGVSNFAAWQVMKACGLAALKGFAPVSCLQPMYNLVKRQAEVELLPMAQSEKIAVFPYSPQAGGLLSGKYQRGEEGRLKESKLYIERYRDKECMAVSDRFVAYAREHDWSPVALAVAWVGAHPAVTAPIIGARSLAQFEEGLGCLDIEITDEVWQEISELSPEPPLATDRSEEKKGRV